MTLLQCNEYEQNQCGNIHELLGRLACGDQDLLDDLVEIEPRFLRDAVEDRIDDADFVAVD